MSLLVIEGWDNIATADIATKNWAGSDNNGTRTVVTTQARTGTKSLRLLGGNIGSAPVLQRILAAADEHATLIVGWALRRDNPGSLAAQELIRFCSDAAATQHVSLGLSTGGVITAYRGNTGGTSLGSSASGLLVVDTWNFVEAKVVLHDSTGSVTVKINGTTVLSLTGVDTKNGGTKTVLDSVQFPLSPAGNNNNSHYIDDIYIANAAGSANNDFIGDLRVRALFPNGNGNSSQMVGSDGNSTDNYLLVDDATPNTADYVGSPTLNNKDTYAFDDLPDTSGTVVGLQLEALATKTDAAARSLALVTRSGSTDYDGSDVALALGSNTYIQQIRETDPATGVAWLRSGVNSAEFGAKVR